MWSTNRRPYHDGCAHFVVVHGGNYLAPCPSMVVKQILMMGEDLGLENSVDCDGPVIGPPWWWGAQTIHHVMMGVCTLLSIMVVTV